jgi:hypothetical protein
MDPNVAEVGPERPFHLRSGAIGQRRATTACGLDVLFRAGVHVATGRARCRPARDRVCARRDRVCGRPRALPADGVDDGAGHPVGLVLGRIVRASDLELGLRSTDEGRDRPVAGAALQIQQWVALREVSRGQLPRFGCRISRGTCVPHRPS